MSREDGFAVMDVSTDIANDPKVRRLFREFPEHAAVAFIAYMATMGESWKAGRRAAVEESWPAYLPFNQAALDALKRVRLLESKGFVMFKAWSSWFTPALARRAKSRDRWARYNAKRDVDTALAERGSDAVQTRLPRGSDAVTASSVPPVPSSRPSPTEIREIPPPPTSGGRRKDETNPRSTGDAPRQRRANPRANETSTRQVRRDQKRGPTSLAGVLREAAQRKGTSSPAEPAPIDEDLAAWTGPSARTEAVP